MPCSSARAALIVAPVAWTLLACGPADAAHTDANTEASAPGRPALDAAVEDYVANAMDWYGIPGLSVALLSRGEVLHAASSGVADVETGAPVTNATLYQLSSTAKIFSSTALMTLVQEGLVDLDSPVGEMLPDIPASWGHVTPRQLLSHLSGLPDMVHCDTLPEAEAVACALDLGEPEPAGERFAYNQTNYYLVQKIIERTTGTSLPRYLAQRTFEPLKIAGRAVYAGSSAEPVPGRSNSYYPDGEGGLAPRVYAFPPYLFAAAGLNMSLEAVIVWMRALEAGALLDPETMAEMWREPELADGHMSNYALGWDWRTHGAGHRSVGHSGGHLTTVRVFPQDSLAVVVLANGSAWSVDPDRIAEGLAALVVPEILSAGSRLAWEMRAGFAAVATEGRARTGAHEALDLYGRVAADPDRLDASVEREMNRLGYELLERGRTGDAVEVLRLTAAVFPDSWNAHDSLGEAYLADGNTELARMEYRRSLELNPENENAREVLRGLPADI